MKKHILSIIVLLLGGATISTAMEHACRNSIRDRYIPFYNNNIGGAALFIKKTLKLCSSQQIDLKELAYHYSIALEMSLVFQKEKYLKTLLIKRIGMSKEFQLLTTLAIHKTYVKSLDFFGPYASQLFYLGHGAVQINLKESGTGFTPLHKIIQRYNEALMPSITSRRAQLWREEQISRAATLLASPNLDLTVSDQQGRTALQFAGVTQIGLMLLNTVQHRALVE